MRIRVQKWGNSLAVRIPRSFAREAALSDGADVELVLESGRRLVITAVTAEYELKDLLEQVTPATQHDEVDTGSAAGKELW